MQIAAQVRASGVFSPWHPFFLYYLLTEGKKSCLGKSPPFSEELLSSTQYSASPPCTDLQLFILGGLSMYWKSFKFLTLTEKIVFYLKHKQSALTTKAPKQKKLAFNCKDKHSKISQNVLAAPFPSHPLQQMRQGLNGWWMQGKEWLTQEHVLENNIIIFILMYAVKLFSPSRILL